MPCRVDPTPEEEARWRRNAEEKRKLEEERQRKLKRDLDKATRLLCEVMRTYDLESPSDELLTWWEAHKKMDAARLRKERRKQAEVERQERELQEHSDLLKKLNKKERALLKKHGVSLRGK